jgi:hypothetical protein
MPRFRLPKRPRLKFALLGAAGGALILLPLGQVLRYQAADLQALSAERALLDPMAHALSVQRALIAHRDAADRVLRGRGALEGERRLRQADVDERLRMLQNTLSSGWWMRALQESQSMLHDWHQLARRVTLRQGSAAESLAAHQLLIEQAVQVMDLLGASAPGQPTAALAALQPRAQPANEQEQLAGLENALLALDAQLLLQQARVREQQASLTVALAALVALGLAALLRSRGWPGPPGDTPDGDGVRRGHGRRTTDLAPQRDGAGPLIDRLRSGSTASSSEPL